MSVFGILFISVLAINSGNVAIDATQPSNDGQAQGNIWSTFWERLLKFFYGGPLEDKVGLGKPSENPYVIEYMTVSYCMIDNRLYICFCSLFLNIAIPPSFPEKKNFPVKVYIHGGYVTQLIGDFVLHSHEIDFSNLDLHIPYHLRLSLLLLIVQKFGLILGIDYLRSASWQAISRN